MRSLKLNYRPNTLIVALFAGALLPLAFAPHHIGFLGLLSPALLAGLWYLSPSPIRAFNLGFCYGLGLFTTGVSWVYVSIHHYGNTSPPLAILITGLFVCILALYPAFQGYLLKKLYKAPSATLFFLFGFPSCFVLFEVLRGWLFSGFPWLYLGYTQLDTVLGNYAPLLGVYGVSWMLAVSAGALGLIWTKARIRSTQRRVPICIGISVLILIWGVGGGLLSKKTWTTPTGPLQSFSLIQGNVCPLDKFTAANPIEAVEALYGRLTEKEWGTDIIVWPENAIPLPLPYSKPYVEKLNREAKEANTTLITGIQTLHPTYPTQYYNSMIALGLGSGIYHKLKLVPFGEFLPFDQKLRGLIHFFDIPMSNFTKGPLKQDLLYINSKNTIIAPLICYEIAYPEIVQKMASKANFLINISEDGWFGTSWGPYQHLEIARMRAKETGRMLLRATTCGISALIDSKGNIISRSPQFQIFVLKGTVQGYKGETPWVKIGLWPIMSVLLSLFLLGSYLSRTRKQTKT